MVTISKEKFSELYDIACDPWKQKFNEKLKNFIFSKNVEFEYEFLDEIRRACTNKQIIVFNKLFSKFIDSNDLFKFDTYKKVCKKLGEKELTHLDFGNIPHCDVNKVLNIAKIKQIERFFNGNWIPNKLYNNQNKWYPYFKFGSGGLEFSDSYFYYYDCYGPVAYFKDKKTSDFVGKTFIDLYQNI